MSIVIPKAAVRRPVPSISGSSPAAFALTDFPKPAVPSAGFLMGQSRRASNLLLVGDWTRNRAATQIWRDVESRAELLQVLFNRADNLPTLQAGTFRIEMNVIQVEVRITQHQRVLVVNGDQIAIYDLQCLSIPHLDTLI